MQDIRIRGVSGRVLNGFPNLSRKAVEENASQYTKPVISLAANLGKSVAVLFRFRTGPFLGLVPQLISIWAKI